MEEAKVPSREKARVMIWFEAKLHRDEIRFAAAQTQPGIVLPFPQVLPGAADWRIRYVAKRR
jgi:hypothetical protein